MLRILLVNQCRERQSLVAEHLREAGCEIVAGLALEDDLLTEVRERDPDVVLIDLDSPGRDILESLRSVQANVPRPMVMFCPDDDGATIQRAIAAGVSAYVADRPGGQPVRAVIESAMAMFQRLKDLESELQRARSELAARKTIDRAKGVLMTQLGLSEDEAYQRLRRAAMKSNKKLVEVAEGILLIREILGEAGNR